MASSSERAAIAELVNGTLTLEELEFYRDAAVLVNEHPLSKIDAITVVLRGYEDHFGLTTAAERHVDRDKVQHYLELLSPTNLLYRNTARFSTALAAHKCSCTAMPVISCCLQCHKPLTAISYEPGTAVFYDLGNSGVVGRLYTKECSSCQITYQLDGYQHSVNYKHGGGCKLPYPKPLQHAKWFRSTSKTVISLRLLYAQEGSLQFGQTGFQPCSNMSSWVASGGAFCDSVMAGPADTTRQQLVHRRLAEGFMRYHAQQVFVQSFPHMLPNVNLKMDLDPFLDMATVQLEMVNRARYFHHCKHSVTSKWCGKFEQMDGNQKVKRSRCSAVLDLPVAYGEPLTSGEHLYYSKFCPETPVRDDPDGYCKDCRARVSSQAVHDSQVQQRQLLLQQQQQQQLLQQDRQQGRQQEALPLESDDEDSGTPYSRMDIDWSAAGPAGPVDETAVQDASADRSDDPLVYLSRFEALSSGLPDPSGGDAQQRDLFRRSASYIGGSVPAAAITAAAAGGAAAVAAAAAADTATSVASASAVVGMGGPAADSGALASAGAPLYDDVYPAERIEDERYSYKLKQVVYKVKWAGSKVRTWEPINNIVLGRGQDARALYDEWKNRAVPVEIFSDDPVELLPEPGPDIGYSGPLPSTHAGEQQQQQRAGGGASSSRVQQSAAALSAGHRAVAADGEQDSAAAAVSAAAEAAAAGTTDVPRCKLRGEDLLRKEGKYSNVTGGVIVSVCECGFPNCPMELPEAEGCAAMACYLMINYRDESMVQRDGVKVFGFDDMCHLARFAEKRKDAHPKLAEFVNDTIKIVDKFHFAGHVGAYCQKYTNPYTWGDAVPDNMSIAEQYFRRFGRFKYSFRYMNRSRFRFMLQVVCMLDQRAFEKGFK